MLANHVRSSRCISAMIPKWRAARLLCRSLSPTLPLISWPRGDCAATMRRSNYIIAVACPSTTGAYTVRCSPFWAFRLLFLFTISTSALSILFHPVPSGTPSDAFSNGEAAAYVFLSRSGAVFSSHHVVHRTYAVTTERPARTLDIILSRAASISLPRPPLLVRPKLE